MALDTQARLRYTAPLNDFNPRSFWEEWQNRFRDPGAYLDCVGIERICDMLLSGLSPKEISRTLGLGLVTILKWIEGDDARKEQYEWALTVEADNMMFAARDVIRDAPLIPEAINKAGKLAEHYRHMSKGFGQRRWGNKVDVNAQVGVSLNYTFNVALTPEEKARVLEGEAKPVEKPKLMSLDNLIGAGNTIPLHIGVPYEKDELNYEEAKANEEGEASE